MRVGYSILRELKKGGAGLLAEHYGLTDVEFHRMITLLERQGYLERILRAGDLLSLKPARVTSKGIAFLLEQARYEVDYPNAREDLALWVQADKELYFNGAED